MDKLIYDKGNGLQYELHGDYYLPCLSTPEQDGEPIGIWGQRHRRYLREHKDGIYTGMLLTGKLNKHLEEIDRQANEMLERLMQQYAAAEGVTEAIKGCGSDGLGTGYEFHPKPCGRGCSSGIGLLLRWSRCSVLEKTSM